MTEREKIISLARACSKPDTSDCYHNKYFTLDIEELETFFKAAQNVAYEKATRVCELAVEQCKDAETKLDTTELGAKAIITGAIYQANKLADAIKAMKEQS